MQHKHKEPTTKISGMKLAGPRPDQECYLDSSRYRSITSVGELRPVLGDEAELIASVLLGAKRLATATDHWCPDLQGEGSTFYEVKLCAQGTAITLHESQVHAACRRDIDYRVVVVRYPGGIRCPINERVARNQLSAFVTGVVVVPASAMRAALASAKVEELPDGRLVMRIPPKVINRWWRSRTCGRYRGEIDDRLVEVRTWGDETRGDWWPMWCRDTAASMACELESSRHLVELRPAPRRHHASHSIRVVTQSLPTWYQELCTANPVPCRSHLRKPSTAVKRSRILRALEHIVHDEPIRDATEAMLWPYLQSRAQEAQTAYRAVERLAT